MPRGQRHIYVADRHTFVILKKSTELCVWGLNSSSLFILDFRSSLPHITLSNLVSNPQNRVPNLCLPGIHHTVFLLPIIWYLYSRVENQTNCLILAKFIFNDFSLLHCIMFKWSHLEIDEMHEMTGKPGQFCVGECGQGWDYSYNLKTQI